MRRIIKKKCKNCKKEFKDFLNRKNLFCSKECEVVYWNKYHPNSGQRGPSYNYKCRLIVTKNRTGDVFGITIPKVIVDDYNLKGKRFNISISEEGEFIIKTKIEYTEI